MFAECVHAHGGQRITFGSQFSPLIVSVLEIKLRLSGLGKGLYPLNSPANPRLGSLMTRKIITMTMGFASS